MSGVLVTVVPVLVINLFFGSCIRSVFTTNAQLMSVVLLIATMLLLFTRCTGPHVHRAVSPLRTLVVNVDRSVTMLPKLSHSNAAVTAKLVLNGGGRTITRFSFLVIVPPVLNRTLLGMVSVVGSPSAVTGVKVLPLAMTFMTTLMSNYVTYGFVLGVMGGDGLICFTVCYTMINVTTFVCSFMLWTVPGVSFMGKRVVRVSGPLR